MKDKIMQKEIDLARLETLKKEFRIKDHGFLKRARKAIEDNKELRRIEAANPHKKSWQDNIWLYLIITIIITVIAGVIGYLIIQYVL